MRNFVNGMTTNAGVVGEVLRFLWARKLWWLLPMVTVLLLLGLLLVFASSSKEIVNAKIKFREPFRPFAPVVLEERAHEYFTMPNLDKQICLATC